MKWNELYEKNKNRKYREINTVKSDIVLKSRVNSFFNNYSKCLIVILLIISILLILAFYSRPKVLFLSFIMFGLILLLSIYFNTFTIKCKNNIMNVKMNMQEIKIDYSDIKNIYIEKRKIRLFIKKKYYFSLVILYKAPNKNISNINLPTTFLNEKDLEKFLNVFTLKEIKSNNIEKAQKYQLKMLLIKIAAFFIVWLIIIISLLLK